MATGVTPQAQLLSSTKLRITAWLVRGRPEPEAVILRAVAGDRRLVVTPAQADLLTGEFAELRSVPEVLIRTIAEGRCPPLREFYELVVQAHAAGILVAEPPKGDPPRALRWWLRLPVSPTGGLAGLLALAGLAAIALSLPQWRGPGDWLDVILGWLIACALLSAGEALGAGVIASCGDVRNARLHWRTRFPHFRIDAFEAIMGGRACERAVAALRAAPLLVGTAIVGWKHPGWFPALCGAALFVLSPFGPSAARQWLASRRQAPQYSVRVDFMFEPVRGDHWVRWSARWRASVAEFGWLGVEWTVVWAAWLVVAFVRCLPNTAATVGAWVRGAPRPVHLGAELLLVFALGLGLIVWAWAAIRHWRLVRAWSRPMRGVDARDPNRPGLTGERADLLAQVPLFQGLDRDSRVALGEAMTLVECGRHEEVTREDEPGDDFFVVVDGELAVQKRLPGKRRSATIGWLGPGDCLGEIALLEHTARTATTVATRRARLLRLKRADFERLVVGRLGAASIQELLQNARFLGRLTFTAGWPFAELVKFARRCRTLRFDADVAPIVQGTPNQWFYLIFDGAFEARDGRRVLRRMGPGDYFGEISLLEGWPATATVVALEESRCLALARRDFLELFARDFRIALRMEAVAEQRLGSKVFVAR